MLRTLILGIFIFAFTTSAVERLPVIQGTKLKIDNVQIDGNTLSTTNTNGDLTIDLNGSGSTIFTDLTASRVLTLDGSKKLAVSAVTPTTLGYLDISSSLTTLLAAKAPTASPTFSGTITTPLTASRVLVTGASSELSASSVTSTTLGYLDISSSLTTLLAAKAPAASPTFSGTVNIGTTSAGVVVGSGAGALSIQSPLSIANGGTNNASLAVTAGGVLYTDGSKVANVGVGTTGQFLVSQAAGAPTWTSVAARVTGEVFMTAATTCPAGSMHADGSSLLRSGGTGCGGGACATLFTAIGTTYGAADGTHFNLPDTRGVFPRGQGSQTISSITYTGTQGTTQGDAFQNFTGTFDMPTNTGGWAASASGAFSVSAGGTGMSNTASAGSSLRLTLNPSTTVRTSTETRPANISLKYCIVY